MMRSSIDLVWSLDFLGIDYAYCNNLATSKIQFCLFTFYPVVCKILYVDSAVRRPAGSIPYLGYRSHYYTGNLDIPIFRDDMQKEIGEKEVAKSGDNFCI